MPAASGRGLQPCMLLRTSVYAVFGRATLARRVASALALPVGRQETR